MKCRAYPSYGAYLEHQRSKTLKPEVKHRIVSTWDERVAEFTRWFKPVVALLPKAREVICLGARYGCEVQAFIDLGCKAVGIDIVPCPPLVVEGDFQDVPFGAASFDLVYCNALDHAFDLDVVLKEADRILRGRGHLLLHLDTCKCGQYEATRLDGAEDVTSRLPNYAVVFNKRVRGKLAAVKHALLLRRKAK